MSKTEQIAIQELLRFRVDLEANRGNKEQLKLAEKAVKWFVRRYIKTTAIKELQRVLETKEPRSKCITVPRSSLEAPLTVLTYLRIWRWPTIRDDSQLLNELFCNHKLSRVSSANPNEEVCINPYHYKLAGIEQPTMKVYAPIGKVKRDASGNTMSVTSSERSVSFNHPVNFELSGALTAGLDSLQDAVYPNTTPAATPVNVELKRPVEMSNSSVAASQFSSPSNGHAYGAANANSSVYSYGGNNFAVANNAMFPQQPTANATRYAGNASQFGGFAKSTSPTPIQSPSSSAAAAGYFAMNSESGASISMDEDMPMETDVKKKPEETVASPASVQSHSVFSYGAASSSATINYTGAVAQNGASSPFAMTNYAQASQNGLFASPAGMMSPYAQSQSLASPAASVAASVQQSEYTQENSEDVAYGEVVYVEPTCWCSVQYYEKLNHLGETFHCGQPTLTIDGFCDPNSADRFCLGRISNPNREPDAEHVRRLIQRGVKLYYVAGEMYLENLSENAVFVQSSNMNMRNDWPLCAVCKVSPGETAQLFANQDFAGLLAHNVNEGYESVYKLTYMCVIRMSFVKGWGAKYHRQTLSSVPCWVEIRLNGALQWLDRVLRQMGSPGLQTSSIS